MSLYIYTSVSNIDLHSRKFSSRFAGLQKVHGRSPAGQIGQVGRLNAAAFGPFFWGEGFFPCHVPGFHVPCLVISCLSFNCYSSNSLGGRKSFSLLCFFGGETPDFFWNVSEAPASNLQRPTSHLSHHLVAHHGISAAHDLLEPGDHGSWKRDLDACSDARPHRHGQKAGGEQG